MVCYPMPPPARLESKAYKPGRLALDMGMAKKVFTPINLNATLVPVKEIQDFF